MLTRLTLMMIGLPFTPVMLAPVATLLMLVRFFLGKVNLVFNRVKGRVELDFMWGPYV